MAPTITAAMTSSQEHLTLTHKLRKPQVEKLRKERINSSIEQLKSLLGADTGAAAEPTAEKTAEPLQQSAVLTD
ncbi:Transcription factor HES-5 Hairy and enhancer of split 5 [Channa argus]|uniref:Transcription factor HES-5 Hairy and enhancer of split 5 n=1 Tax=Channa argus TaxID=215402 RepID=A0A6G1PIR4_CHAAH|nr:Transcription factor HES-5 Hairy and enhancer of split 5 [Channa argus]